MTRLSRRFFLFDYSQQLNRSFLDLGIAALTGPAFHSEQAAAVEVFEIAIWELIARLCLLGVTFVHREMPLCIFVEAVDPNKFIFLVSRRLIRLPEPFVVRNEASLTDQLTSVLERGHVQS